jgi:hypothetical protein
MPPYNNQPGPAFPAPPPPDKGDNRFGFFLEPPPKQRRNPLSLPQGMSPKAKMILIVVGIIGILVAFGIVMTIIQNIGNNIPTLTATLKKQQEIIRISDQGLKNARSSTLLNFSANTKIVAISDQKQFLNYINANGGRISIKDVNQLKVPENDQVLSAAVAAGTFDSAYQTLIEQLLTDYEKDLALILSNNELRRSQRDLVLYSHSSIEPLLQQLKAQQPQ